VDIYEQPDAILVVAEIPGLALESIHVAVVDGMLRVSGARPKMIPEDTLRVHQIEIPYGPFARDVQLPHWVDMERCEASYEEGCLKVRIPRKASP
jgi:HSP20 family protein